MGWGQRSPVSPELGIKNAERLFLKHVLPVKAAKRTIRCCWRCRLVITRHKKYKTVRLQGSNAWQVSSAKSVSVTLQNCKLCTCLCVCIGVWAYEGRCLQRVGKVVGSLQLELQVVARHPTWVLGTGLRPSARTVYALDVWAIFPAPSQRVSTCKTYILEGETDVHKCEFSRTRGVYICLLYA